MKFVRLFLTVAVLLLTGAAMTQADAVSKKAKIEEIFQLAKLDQQIQQALENSANHIKSGFFQDLMGVQLTPEEQRTMLTVQTKLQDLLKEALSWETLKPDYVKLYAELFTEDEIDGMLAFYRSPAGKAMLEKTPQLMAQGNAVVQQRMLAMKPQFEALIRQIDGLKGK